MAEVKISFTGCMIKCPRTPDCELKNVECNNYIY